MLGFSQLPPLAFPVLSIAPGEPLNSVCLKAPFDREATDLLYYVHGEGKRCTGVGGSDPSDSCNRGDMVVTFCDSSVSSRGHHLPWR